MTITLDNTPIVLPKEDMTVAELIEWRHMASKNIAFVINGKLVRRENYEMTRLHEGDCAMTVTAAFGG